jgi:hypothetical protein
MFFSLTHALLRYGILRPVVSRRLFLAMTFAVYGMGGAAQPHHYRPQVQMDGKKAERRMHASMPQCEWMKSDLEMAPLGRA